MKAQENCRWARGGARRRHKRYSAARATVTDPRTDGNIADLFGDDAVAFARSWTEAADQFLGSGCISPTASVAVAKELGIRPEDLPTDLHQRVFRMVCEAARVGVDDLQSRIDVVLPWFEPSVRDEVRYIAMSDGSGVNAATFGRWVREHSLRAWFYLRSRDVLSDPRPIGEIAAELLEGVAHAR